MKDSSCGVLLTVFERPVPGDIGVYEATQCNTRIHGTRPSSALTEANITHSHVDKTLICTPYLIENSLRRICEQKTMNWHKPNIILKSIMNKSEGNVRRKNIGKTIIK